MVATNDPLKDSVKQIISALQKKPVSPNSPADFDDEVEAVLKRLLQSSKN